MSLKWSCRERNNKIKQIVPIDIIGISNFQNVIGNQQNRPKIIKVSYEKWKSESLVLGKIQDKMWWQCVKSFILDSAAY